MKRRLELAIDAGLAKRVDRAAKKAGLTRTGWIVRLLVDALDGPDKAAERLDELERKVDTIERWAIGHQVDSTLKTPARPAPLSSAP